jgi:hypothetical protein
MAYIRKTHEEYDIEQFCYGSWEVVNTELTWQDAKRSRAECRENQPEYPVRIRMHRVKNGVSE